jgi:UDP-4-amino-4-deoxy-L-arabinose formyltransferase/UDP-glucuronic acid dehydrogenase (UDP-4-keto-hexauronic acid decarboxylating)
MKVAALGRTHWLLDAARRLHDAGHELTLVATAPGVPEYRADEEDFRAFAADAGATFALDEVPETGAELAVSVNWPRLLTPEVIERFPRGIVNAHAGDLPRYRGNAAPNWAIINGEPEVVLTFHLMDESLDSGPVLRKTPFPIGARTTIGDVYAWLNAEIPQGFVDVVGGLEAGTLEARPQPADPALALRVPPRRPEDSELDWEQGAAELDRLVRASSEPFAGAFSFLQGERITVWRARPEATRADAAVGELLEPRADGVAVATGDGLLVLQDVEHGGRRGRATELLGSAHGRLGRA